MITQHKKNIEDLTRFFEKRLEEAKSQILNIEREKKNEIDEKNSDFEKKLKVLENEKKKIWKENEAIYKKKLQEELWKKDEEIDQREKDLKRDYEGKLKGLFEKMHGEYEEQLAENELMIKNLEKKLREKEMEIGELMKINEIESRKNWKNYRESSAQTDFEEEEKDQIKISNFNFENQNQIIISKPKMVSEERGMNTEENTNKNEKDQILEKELEAMVTRFESILDHRNRVIASKDQKIKDLQKQIINMADSQIPISLIKQIILP